MIDNIRFLTKIKHFFFYFVFNFSEMSKEKFNWTEEQVELLNKIIENADGGSFKLHNDSDSQKNHIYLKR